MEKVETEKIFLEQIIAGALLKTPSLDVSDICFLAEQICSQMKIDYSSYIRDSSDIWTVIERRKGRFFDRIDKKETKEILERVRGPLLADFFESWSPSEFASHKEEYLRYSKEYVLNHANVLLISEDDEHCEALRRKGFVNIDRFRSIVRAEKYFTAHSDTLNRYHIILYGKQSIEGCFFTGDAHKFIDYLFKFAKKRGIVFTSIRDHNVHFRNYAHNLWWQTMDADWDSVIDEIIISTVLNDSIAKVGLQDASLPPVDDYINPENLPLPSKNEDLKILFLGVLDEKKVFEKYGLSVSVAENNNPALEKNVKDHLGEYDIIIAGGVYSDALVNFAAESTEQCKDTGRQLTLLMVYDKYKNNSMDTWMLDENGQLISNLVGEPIELQYCFAGPRADSSSIKNVHYKVAKEKGRPEGMYRGNLSALLSAINFYWDKLAKLGFLTDKVKRFPSPSEYTEEYDGCEEKQKKRIAISRQDIQEFDKFTSKIKKYVRLRRMGYQMGEFDDLQIIEGSSGISVEVKTGNKKRAVLTFSEEAGKSKVRIFYLQTCSSKGKLMPPVRRGFYSAYYENFNSVPPRPTSQELLLLKEIYQKIKIRIMPALANAENEVLDNQTSRISFKPKKRPNDK